MKFTLAWLERYLEHGSSAAEVAERLTSLGLEVEALDDPGAALAPFVVARVLTAERHPRADRLQLLSVDSGSGEPVPVVCGAPNARAGMLGVFGPPGAHVPGAGFTLGVATIRGVESRGMMCSARELGLGEESDGILELAADAPVGQPYARWAGLDDWRFQLSITPDRADAMSVRGLARDLAASGLGRLKPLGQTARIEDGSVVPHGVAIEDSRAIAFLSRTVEGVANGPSPPWLARLLEGAGLRPVSAIVDVTQYCSIGLGRPLHVYDADRLAGPLVARAARRGERVAALNGRRYDLDPSMLVIADDAAVHDIAGVMGGIDSSVTAATRRVVIESALFDPATVARTGRRLGLVTDARQRFERGLDPGFAAPGLDLAAAMMVELAGGRVSRAVAAGDVPDARREVAWDPALVARLGGLFVAEAEQRAMLGRLGFAPAGERAMRVPGWRPDVERPADLVAEVVRLHGVDRVPASPLPAAPARARLDPQALLVRRLARRLAAEGLHEVMSWSFVSEAEGAAFGQPQHRLANPLSAELAVMRPSLLSGLVAAAGRALARQAETVAMFERGRRYGAGERTTLALVLAGRREPRHWRGRPRPVDAHDARAIVAGLLAEAGVAETAVEVVPGAGPAYHPGRSARLAAGGAALAELGEVHPALALERGIGGPLVMAELFVDALVPALPLPGGALSPYPPVLRDFAFWVPADVPAGRLLAAIRQALAREPAAIEVSVFDMWVPDEAAPGGSGEVSLGVHVRAEPAEATWDEARIAALSQRVGAAGAALGARLRDG